MQDLMTSALQGQRPADAFAAIENDSLSDGIGAGYGVLGYKGKVWTLRHRGEKHTFVRPDDGTPLPYIDVIILRSVPYKSKSYYPEGSFQDVGSDGKRPTCSSLDGVTPDADAMQKQAVACAICPRNEWKTSADGRKGRECADYKRMAVLLLPALSARLFPNNAPLMEPVFLRVPAGSLVDLGLYGDNLKNQNWNYFGVVTRVGFDPQAPHPKMTFKAIQALTNKEAPVVLPLRNDALAQRITGESEVGKPRAQIGGVAPLQTVMGAASQIVLPQGRSADPPADMGGFGGAPVIELRPNPAPPAAVTATVTPPADLGMVDTGFGLVGQEQPTQLTVVANKNTEADVGPASEADMDLDAKIAAKLGAMLPK